MKERGFTIIEIVITTALLSSALLAAAITFVSISRLQVKTAASRTAQDSGRYILEQMARDIRSSAAISNPTADCLNITADNQFGGGQISYKYDGTSAIWRNLGACSTSAPATRISDTNTRVLPNGATVFQLVSSSQSKPSVKIHFTVRQADASLDGLTGANSYAYTYNVDTVITAREQ